MFSKRRVNIRCIDTLSGVVTSKLFLTCSENRSIQEGKDLLPLLAKFAPVRSKLFSFYSRHLSFQKGLDVQERKLEVTKVISLVENSRKSTKCTWSP